VNLITVHYVYACKYIFLKQKTHRRIENILGVKSYTMDINFFIILDFFLFEFSSVLNMYYRFKKLTLLAAIFQ
jgi:hypothetical protein